MNANEIQKKIAYDLTLEYVRQNKSLDGNNIPDKVKLFKQYYDEFLQAVKDNNLL